MSCVLLFDIGNTNTKIGIYQKNSYIDSYSIPSDRRQTEDQFGLILESIVRRLNINTIEACIGSSVVPDMNHTIRMACKKYLNTSLLFVPEDIPVPLENRYSHPYEVGADRLVGAFAARRLHPNSHSIISIDFGTATTFDCVEGNAYLGGLICPGIFSSASALSSQTAKLPRINLEVKESLPTPGISTATSLSHGFVFGFAAMAEGLCKKLSATMKGPVRVIGTGGFACHLAKVTNCFDEIRPDLLLDGLKILYEEHQGNSLERS